MRSNALLITMGLILPMLAFLFICNVPEEVSANPPSNKFALIAVSSANQTHDSEYEKSVAFYEYLIEEGYTANNIYYYGPSSISYTDGDATTINIDNGFDSLAIDTNTNSEVIIYISDHIKIINSIINFNFNDGTILENEIRDYFNSISYSSMTFVMNGNRSGLVDEFRDQDRTIIASMSSTNESCPDYFNITRSLEDNDADTNSDGNISFYEAFNYEVSILTNDQRVQTPQYWQN